MSDQEELNLENPEDREPVEAELVGAEAGGNGTGGDKVLKDLMDQNFLEYASYVIRDRAIPHMEDGLKPVQRRILFSLHENDDGKFIKVANIVGYCMQYHPHGDASIADALVSLANKRYLIEGQGNYGNLYTGDPAAASRYIECRLTDLARDHLFNKHLTEFIPSYDGRNHEPVILPAKLPLLLMLGAEGIAVGLATRILPHNFGELIKGQIAILKKRSFKILPDFQQGGTMDTSEYDKGRGKVKVRAVIKKKGSATLIIHEIAFGTNTESLVRSIEDAIRKKKLKIKSIQDYTAENVEIHLHLAPGASLDKTLQGLYAFTDCEVSHSSNVLAILDQRPVQMNVNEVLRHNTLHLVKILKAELLHEKNSLLNDFHNKTLVQIFVENRIYKKIEECKTYDAVQKAVLSGVNEFRHLLRRDVTLDDVEMLLAVRIKRISLFDINKNRKDIDDILIALDECEKNLKSLTEYAIKFLESLHRKYAKQYPRLTKTDAFEQIEVRELTAEELSLCYDQEAGYFGHAVKGDESVVCSSLDKIIFVWADGRYKLTPPPEKMFVDKDLIYVAKFDRKLPMTAVYTTGTTTYLKKFTFGGTIQNREYRLAPEKSKVLLYAADDPELIYLKFRPAKNQRVHQLIVKNKDYLVKGVKAKGNQLTLKKISSIGVTKPRGWKDSNVDDSVGLVDF